MAHFAKLTFQQRKTGNVGHTELPDVQIPFRRT